MSQQTGSKQLPSSSVETASSPEGSEIVFAMVAAVGVNLLIAEKALSERLEDYGYHCEDIKITRDVISRMFKGTKNKFPGGDFDRINKMMDLGDEARGEIDKSILAMGAAAEIASRRRSAKKTITKRAYIIHSLKHPDEVRKLREIYPRGFHLIGVHAHPDFRRKHLVRVRKMTEKQAEELMVRDRKGEEKHEQQLVDTFHLADLFVGWSGDDNMESTQATLDLGTPTNGTETYYDVNSKRVAAAIHRYVDLIFGHRYKTPTFGEHAMFMAFTAALRSADLSRQVGAVMARDGEILSNGSNDCPAPQGGLYWPYVNPESRQVEDISRGRDFMRGFDSNRDEQDALIDEISAEFSTAMAAIDESGSIQLKNLKEKDPDRFIEIEKEIQSHLRAALEGGGIRNLTEYGRVVHAEMEAILSCARQGVSTKGATIYCTTFPCHNCAKHIIAAGIKRVVFIEPYLKSKALDFHDDSIVIHYPQDGSGEDEEVKFPHKPHVKFEPFFGVGPRRFLDLFSLNLGVGRPLERKNSSGRIIPWSESTATPRLQMHHESYLELESDAALKFEALVLKKKARIDSKR